MGPNKNMTQKNCLRSFFKVSHSSITIFKKFFEEEKFLRITDLNMPKKDFAKELKYLNIDQNLQITKF